uniref:Uncharacterized protein n=1 Tax=Bombyx mori TaxID=7091 RepID=A0A8R2QX40_BOMMO|nr:uncharacterized protein LOC119629040 [Bombyx mori]
MNYLRDINSHKLYEMYQAGHWSVDRVEGEHVSRVVRRTAAPIDLQRRSRRARGRGGAGPLYPSTRGLARVITPRPLIALAHTHQRSPHCWPTVPTKWVAYVDT